MERGRRESVRSDVREDGSPNPRRSENAVRRKWSSTFQIMLRFLPTMLHVFRAENQSVGNCVNPFICLLCSCLNHYAHLLLHPSAYTLDTAVETRQYAMYMATIYTAYVNTSSSNGCIIIHILVMHN